MCFHLIFYRKGHETYMDYVEFREEIFNILKGLTAKDVSIELVESEKLNSCIRYGIMFNSASLDYAHTIYLEPFYRGFQNGKSLDQIAKDLLKCFEEEKAEIPESIDKFSCYDSAKEHIYCKLIHIEKNQKMLHDTPHITFLDFAIVAYFEVNSTAVYKGSILIKEQYLKQWEITAEKLLTNALDHTLKRKGVMFLSMEEVLTDFRHNNLEKVNRKTNENMYVLTNREKYLGATLIYFPKVMKRIAQTLGEDFYLLPASIHEWIIIPQSAVGDEKQLLSVVRNMNRYEVLEEEVLTDDIYFYSANVWKDPFRRISDEG